MLLEFYIIFITAITIFSLFAVFFLHISFSNVTFKICTSY